jgi:opacity protein-like surface antigen
VSEDRFTSSNGVNTFVPGKGEVRTDGTSGYQVGGGGEFRIGGRWSVTGEYLFASFDDLKDGTVPSQGPAPPTNPFILVNAAGTDLQRSDRFEFHAVRAGLSYRF